MLEHWIVYSLVCSLLNCLQGAFVKHLAMKLNRYLVTWSIFAFSVPFMVILLVVTGVPPVKPSFFPALAGALLTNALAFTLYVRALQVSPLSLTIPFLSFTPFFLILTGRLILGELPTPMGIVGIVLIIGGAYSINLERAGQGLLSPFKNIYQERGSLLMLVTAALWSLSSTMDKAGVLSSSPAFYTISFHIFLPFLYIALLSPQEIGLKDTVPNFWPLLLLGGLQMGVALSQMHAIEIGLVSYVIAVKRGGLLFSIVLGALFFRERMFAVRFIGGALMATGVFFIVLG